MIGLMLGILAASAGVGWLLTGLARRYTLGRDMLDRPNPRSLHLVPTPRGGGVGLMVPVLGALALAGVLGLMERGAALGLGVGGALVAGIGWLDDRRSLGAGPRLLVHLLAAAGLVASIGGFGSLRLGGASLTLGGWGSALAVRAVMWCINLYNFMDGIDGLAGLEAVMVGGVGGALLLARGAPGLALVAWAIAGASAGFLGWNWPPARIFIGDVGAGLLGFLFAGLALAGERSGALPALVWVLLLGVFMADTTITLIRRLLRGERWYTSHQSHAYQRLVRHGWTHRSVDLAVLGLNLMLTLLAAAACRWPTLLPAALTIGSGVLAGAYISVERRFPLSSSADPTA